MSILVSVFIPGLDAPTYDHINGQVKSLVETCPGFRAHTAHASPGGWTVTEIWDDEESFKSFVDKYIAGNLPPGVDITVTELHNVVLAVAT